MTSAQTMQPAAGRKRGQPPFLGLWKRGLPPFLVALALAAMAFSCTAKPYGPKPLHAPYTEGRLWGVAPFANESGASLVDTVAIADAMMAEAQLVGSVDTVPVNRVIAAMRQLGLSRIGSESDARSVMRVLGLDGIIVGTVTAWDPYRPITLGMAIELYADNGREAYGGLDPRELTHSTRGEEPSAGSFGPPGAQAQAAGIFDSRNGIVRVWLDDYANGRTEPASAFGRDEYLVRMDLYTRFVSYRLLRDLLGDEWLAEGRAAPETDVER